MNPTKRYREKRLRAFALCDGRRAGRLPQRQARRSISSSLCARNARRPQEQEGGIADANGREHPAERDRQGRGSCTSAQAFSLAPSPGLNSQRFSTALFSRKGPCPAFRAGDNLVVGWLTAIGGSQEHLSSKQVGRRGPERSGPKTFPRYWRRYAPCQQIASSLDGHARYCRKHLA